MRDWKKLRAFEYADGLALGIYRDAATWPANERYGLTQQVQRAAVSVASNIVEGCGRSSEREYLRFMEIAYGSACEMQYQLSLARRLGFSANIEGLERDAIRLAKALNALLRALPEA